jgi:hypothetical protein
MTTEGDMSRRRFLAIGGAIAAAGTLAPLLDPLSALAVTKWPTGRLSAGDAMRVRAEEFMPTSQFTRWHAGVAKLGPANQKGLRATGSPAEASYLDRLQDDLEGAREWNVTDTIDFPHAPRGDRVHRDGPPARTHAPQRAAVLDPLIPRSDAA